MDWSRTTVRVITTSVLSASACAVLTAAVVLILIPRTYTAKTTLVFPLPERPGSLIAATLGDAPVPQGSDFPLDTYLAILKSDLAKRQVVVQLGLTRIFDVADDQMAMERLGQILRVDLNVDRTMTISARTRGTPSVQQPSDLLHRGVASERDRGARELAARIANNLQAQLGPISDSLKLDLAKVRLQGARERVEAERGALLAAERAYSQRQGELGMPDLKAYAAELTRGMVASQTRYDDLSAQLAGVKRQQQAVQRQIAEQSKRWQHLPGELPFVGVSRKAHQEALDAYREATLRYGPESPAVLAATKRLDTARAEVQRELGSVVAGYDVAQMELAAQRMFLEAQCGSLLRVTQEFAQELRQLPASGLEITRLEAAADRHRERLSRAEAELWQAELYYHQHGLRWSVLDPAQPPRIKTSPRNALSVMIAILLGGLIGAVPGLQAMARRALADDSEEEV